MLSQGQIQQLKQQLIAEKKDIVERLKKNDNFQLQRSHPHDSIGELSSYDNHPADEATELFERGKDLELKEHLEKQLEEIDRALAAITEGTYGQCAVCGTSIPYERLQTIPTTIYCKNIARARKHRIIVRLKRKCSILLSVNSILMMKGMKVLFLMRKMPGRKSLPGGRVSRHPILAIRPHTEMI